MTKLADFLGRVMVTAVKIPRSNSLKYNSMRNYVEVEFSKGDQAYVLDCLMNDRKVDVV